MKEGIRHRTDAWLGRHLDTPFGLFAEHAVQCRNDLRHREPKPSDVGLREVEELAPRSIGHG